MKSHYKWYLVSIWEIQSQWRLFLAFVLIFSLIFASILSMASLCRKVPDELDRFAEEEKYTHLDQSNVSHNDLCSFFEMNCRAVEGHATIREAGTDEWIEFDLFPEDENGYPQNSMTIISGDFPCYSDNTELYIWLSQSFAEEKDLSVGDSYRLCMTDEDENSSNVCECTVKGVYKDTYWFSRIMTSEAVYEKCMGKPLIWSIVIIGVDSIYDYYPLVKAIERSGYKVDGIRQLDILLLIDYTLYAALILLGCLAVFIAISLTKIYYNRRIRYYAVLRTMGLSKMGVYITTSAVITFTAAVSFTLAILIAPMMNNYILDVLTDLVGDNRLEVSIWHRDSFLTFIIAELLIWGSCVICQWTLREQKLAVLIRNVNE